MTSTWKSLGCPQIRFQRFFGPSDWQSQSVDIFRSGEKPARASHSWGSVLAYQALAELYAEGKIGSGDIDVFVTLGSPLGSRKAPIQQFTRANAIWTGGDRE